MCRVGPVFILPDYQNQAIGQEVLRRVELEFPGAREWQLDTILEERGNCHLYEKVGYVRTGQVEQLKEVMHIVYYRKDGSLSTGSS